jgi:cyclopropane fatty-acyl-phospholipid synthase-like methyltransferase
VETCRVLELGCGDGGNLIPMALALPGAQFVGMDSAATAIERGTALAAALDLTNVTLESITFEDYEPAVFDYVIAHWRPTRGSRRRCATDCSRSAAARSRPTASPT